MPEDHERNGPEYRTLREQYALIAAQDPRYGLMKDLTKHRSSRASIHPLTRENVLLALAAFDEKIREQLADIAIACFNASHTPEILEDKNGEQYIQKEEEEVYYVWDEEAALRICNSRMDAFLIEISDRGTITKFKFERPPYIVPIAWGFEPDMPLDPDDPEMYRLFNRKGQTRRRRRFGDVGDKYDLHGLAWKKVMNKES